MPNEMPPGAEDFHGTKDLPRRRSHEFGADRIADVLAKNSVDCSVVTFLKGPTADVMDSRKLFWTTRTPERDANTRLIEQPADR